jgi:diaminohydroxyphosphoribosylaminopyrimidine deaminase / 5-amino-6-(5-phosphoribosylamino)uracil reductase
VILETFVLNDAIVLDFSRMSDRSVDEKLLHRALDLARQGIGLASPNPYVGAVITDPHGNIVGEGTYTYAGVKHAEILALEQAADKARGGTLYINLEPHAHQGKTPPCTDALIAAAISRVVASMADPNPKVSGRGFAQLRAAGVQVEVGGSEEQARRLNEAFARYIRDRVPMVTLKSAMTIDGKIAPPPRTKQMAIVSNGFSSQEFTAPGFTGPWITGELARAHVHELRHQHDALLTGIGTVLADNPLLTDRSGRPRRRPLLRVILDSHLRLPLESRLVRDAREERKDEVLVFCSSPDPQKQSQLEQAGIRVEKLDSLEPTDTARAHAPHLDLRTVLRRLAQLEITSVMIEAGTTLNSNALASNIVDKVFLYCAPTLLGAGSIPFIANAQLNTANEPLKINHPRLHRFGEDFAVEGYLRDPYEAISDS